jgi:hypothetical protein
MIIPFFTPKHFTSPHPKEEKKNLSGGLADDERINPCAYGCHQKNLPPAIISLFLSSVD